MNNNLIPIYYYKNNDENNYTYINYSYFIINNENLIVAHAKLGIPIKIEQEILNNSVIKEYKKRTEIINLLKNINIINNFINIIPYYKDITNYFEKIYNDEYENRRYTNSVKIIQKYYLEAYYNPDYIFCQKRLKNHLKVQIT